MRRAVAYLRISKDREGMQVGVARQEEDCRRLAERLGVTIERVFTDNDVSASSLTSKRRPAYDEMMQLAEAGQIDIILAYSNSRLTRRTLELERLITAHERTGVQFHTAVSGADDLSSADGRFIARMKANMDAAESERISERTRRAKRQAREEGRWNGGPRPYGFDGVDGVLVPRDDEGAIIAAAAKALTRGRSVLGIIRDLNEKGVTTTMGKTWTTRTLHRVLRRPHPAVDHVTHQGVIALLDDPARRTTPGPGRRWLLSGIATCAHCHAPLRGSGSSLGKGRKGTYPAYRCMENKHLVISAISLDEYISANTVARIASPDMHETLGRSSSDDRDDASKLAAEERELRRRMDELADDIALPERLMQRRTRALQSRLDEIAELRAAMTKVSPLHIFQGHDPNEVWAGLDLEIRRTVVCAVMLAVTVAKGRPGVVPRQFRWRPELPAFDPRRVAIDWA
jgi:site-specific DNA recombinase